MPTTESLVSSIEWNDLSRLWRGKMKRACRLGRRAVVPFLLLLMSAHAREEELFASLLSNSPFGTTTPAEKGRQPEVPTMGFRGYFREEGKWFFNVVPGDSTSGQRGAWMGIGEPSGDLLVKSFDPEAGTLEVEHQGRNWTLHLVKGRIQRLPREGKATGGEEPAASPAKRERLKNIAAEVFRRRAARREAAATGSSRQ